MTNNRQDLIKWMTETRENLTFDNKAKLLKDYWDKKERIKDLEQKEIEVEELKQDLSTRVSNLENQAIILLESEDLELAEFRTLHAQLFPFFKKLELVNTWQYLNDLIQDYFNAIEKIELETYELGETIPLGDEALIEELKIKQKEIKKLKAEIEQLKKNKETPETLEELAQFLADNHANNLGEVIQQIVNYEKRIEELKEQVKENQKGGELDWTRWKDINPNFSEKMVREWVRNGFDYSQTKEWIDIGLTGNDASFAGWLRDEKELKAEEVLNHESLEDLREEHSFSNEEEDNEDLIAERDELKRDKSELEQEVLSLNNRLKNKQQEVGHKEKSLEQLKKDLNQKELNWQKQIKEKNGLITTLTKEVNQLKEKIK